MADYSYVNAALSLTGNSPITTTVGEAPAQVITEQNYEPLVRAALSDHPWKWATKYEVLSRLDPDVHGDPPDPWLSAYQVPTDLLELRGVAIAGMPIAYTQAGDKILTQTDAGDEVVAQYVWRVPEANWPPLFGLAIRFEMEVLFLRGIQHDHEEAAEREKKTRLAWSRAKFSDSKRASTRDPVNSPLLRARNGSGIQPTMPTWR